MSIRRRSFGTIRPRGSVRLGRNPPSRSLRGARRGTLKHSYGIQTEKKKNHLNKQRLRYDIVMCHKYIVKNKLHVFEFKISVVLYLLVFMLAALG